MTVLAGGVSNRTVLVERESGEAWVVKQALAKLRVQVDWFSSPERIHREADGLRWLAQFAPPGSITPLVFEDHARSPPRHGGRAAAARELEVDAAAWRTGSDHVRQFADPDRAGSSREQSAG